MSALSYGRQNIEAEDIAAVLSVLRSDRLTQGPETRRFERELERATGSAHAVAVSSGTAALHLALKALDVGPGACVVTSANTFLASATAALHCGAEVEFVDIELGTGNLDLDLLEARLAQGGVDAVVAVHFAGRPVDMDRLLALKRRHGFQLVEDACHALGATWRSSVGEARNWRIGEHPASDAIVLSFHPVKHITTGEGGAVLMHDPGIARRVLRLRDHGVDRESTRLPFDNSESAPPWFAPMEELGFNYRMSDIAAALGRSQLGRLARVVDQRYALAQRYDEALADLPGVERPVLVPHAWHLYVIRVSALLRDPLMAYLAKRGIGTQVHYYPVPYQPWFRERYGALAFPAAERHARCSLSLPLSPGLSESDQERVVDGLRAFAEVRS